MLQYQHEASKPRPHVGLLIGIIVADYSVYLATFYARVAAYDVQTARVYLLVVCVLLDRLMARVSQSVEGSKTWIADERVGHNHVLLKNRYNIMCVVNF